MKAKKHVPLDIIGFDDREQRHPAGITMPEWMPMHEFFMLIVAPAGCGKTTLILNLLCRIYHHYFNKIIVFSPTIHNDQKWRHLTQAKQVLRPNPHKKVWLPKVKEEKEKGKGDPSHSTQDEATPDEKEWLAMQKDLSLLENFKDSKGVKKRLGSTQYKMWRYLSSQPQYAPQGNRAVSGQTLASAETILNKKRRIDRLSALIVPPPTPLLAQQLKDYHRVLGLPEPTVLTEDDRRLFSSTAAYLTLTGGDRRGGGAFRGQGQRGQFGQRGHSGHLGRGSAGRGRGREIVGRGQTGHGLPQHHHDHHTDQRHIQHKNKEGQDQQAGQQLGEGHATEEESESECESGNKVSPKWLYEEYSEETLEEAMAYQDKVVACLTQMKREMTQADHVCWVFDDMVGSGLFNQKKNNAFKRLSVRRRHFCSSVIGVVQAYKEFPKTSRNNCNVYILFRIDSEDELSVIYKDFPCGLTADHWKIVYEYCVREPYGFMMINTQVKNPRYRLIKNFSEPLDIPLDRRDHPSWVRQFLPHASSSPASRDVDGSMERDVSQDAVSTERKYASTEARISSRSRADPSHPDCWAAASQRKR